jgi:hypothetical protein
MNARSSSRRGTTRSRKAMLTCSLSIIAALCLLCVGVLTRLPAPFNKTEAPRPRPAGQFQADARTLVAAFRFLIEPEVDVRLFPATTSSVPGLFAVQGLPPAKSSSFSNQLEFPSEPHTNGFGRS